MTQVWTTDVSAFQDKLNLVDFTHFNRIQCTKVQGAGSLEVKVRCLRAEIMRFPGFLFQPLISQLLISYVTLAWPPSWRRALDCYKPNWHCISYKPSSLRYVSHPCLNEGFDQWDDMPFWYFSHLNSTTKIEWYSNTCIQSVWYTMLHCDTLCLIFWSIFITPLKNKFL